MHDQIERVVTIMKLCDDMEDFRKKFARVQEICHRRANEFRLGSAVKLRHAAALALVGIKLSSAVFATTATKAIQVD